MIAILFDVIMVDDELAMLKNMSESFYWEEFGFRLAGIFEDVDSALEFIKRNNIDAVITDISMPNKNGIEFAELLNREYSWITVVFLSAYSNFEYLQKALHNNVCDYILKPITHENVSEMLKRLYVRLLKQASEKPPEIERAYDIPVDAQKLMLDIFSGKADNIPVSDMETDMEKFGLGADVLHSPAALIKVEIEHIEDFLTTTWKYGIERLYTALYTIFKAQDTLLFPVTRSLYEISFIAVFKKCAHPIETARSYISQLSENAMNLLCLCLAAEIEFMAADIFRLFDRNRKEETVREYAKTLTGLIFDGNESKAVMYCRDFSVVAGSDSTLMELTAFHIYNVLYDRFGPAALKEGGLYPAEFIIPIEDDGYGFPVHADIMSCCIEDTVRAAARLISESKEGISDIIRQITQYIDNNYAHDITLFELSARFYVSQFYLSRMFKKETGINLTEYIGRVRIEKAINLLEYTDTALQDIAQSVGFFNKGYFFKKFKDYVGVTPQQYRKAKR